MEKLQRIRTFDFAKLQAVLLALVGLLAGMVYSFGGFIIDVLVSFEWITSSETPGLSYGTLLAFGALIGMPVMAGIAGFLMGICEAILYNIFARWFGGIRVVIEHRQSSLTIK